MGNKLYEELERTCERSEKELHDLNDRLEQNKAMMTPQDLDTLVKITDIIKDVKSTMKKIDEMEMMEANQNGYSGRNMNMRYSGNYMTQPVWDRYHDGYSGNSYNGTYTLNTGDGRYSGTSSRYSRTGAMNELEDMLRNARTDREADAIRTAMGMMNRD